MPSVDAAIKTRSERKGRDKQRTDVYSSKHARQQERLAEKRQQQAKPQGGSS